MTAPQRTVRGRVLRSVGGTYEVHAEGGAVLECALRGRLKREKGLGRVAVGDEVEVEVLEDGSCVIGSVLPRRSKFSRRAGRKHRAQLIAANVDQLAAVFSVARPDPVFALLDRFLVAAESNEIWPFLVVNKVDLTGEDEARERFALYEDVGYEALYTSAAEETGIEALREKLVGRITMFAGPSGAGKSSLLNAIQPDLGLRVGELSEAAPRGRHTTVVASLHPLEAGGYVLDTPGLSRLALWEIGVTDLDECFREFRPYLGKCRFPDCVHEHEPDCAIVEAVERGTIARSRYESYLRALEERREVERSY